MAAFNQCTFVGRLGKDPDFSVTSQGKSVAKFSLAVDQPGGRDKDGNATRDTLWLNIVAWEKVAEIAEKYTHKGSQVMIQGRLVIRSYVDREGVKRQAVEIVAQMLQLLDAKSSERPSSSSSSGSHGDDFDPFLDSDDLP